MSNHSIQQGMQLLAQNRLIEAQKLKNILLKQQPKVGAVHYFSAEVSLAEGDYDNALVHLDNALAIEPTQSFLNLKKSEILLGLKRRKFAREFADKAANYEPKNPHLISGVANIYSLCDDHQGAENYWIQAVNMAEDNPQYLFELAKNQFYLGKMDKAENYLNQLLLISPTNGAALHLRSQLKKCTLSANHISQLKEIAEQASLSWSDNMHCQYALAKELEDIGEFKDSFSALEIGAKLRRSHLQVNVKNEIANMQDMAKFITSDKLKKASKGSLSEAPIFIIGMPRTGTTLVERLLCNSKNVKSAGETSDFNLAMSAAVNKQQTMQSSTLSGFNAALQIDFNKLGEAYLNSVQQLIGQSTYFIDKLPFNYLYCGLIKQALPNAKIIHLVRDPMDTCYAIYKTLFHQVYSFSYDLDELAEYYIAYRQLMEHWQNTLPEQILDVHYEDLVSNPDETVQRIYQHCGLEFKAQSLAIEESKTPSSTASAAQIRQPIYTSSLNKWRHFEKQLSPLKEKLEKSGYLLN